MSARLRNLRLGMPLKARGGREVMWFLVRSSFSKKGMQENWTYIQKAKITMNNKY